jgi:hypothetical protein
MRVDESWEARICTRVFSTRMSRSNENKSCMRVDESREVSVCTRVFSTRMPRSNENESWWESRSESLHESFLNSHVPVKQEQELHESWWELRSKSFHESNFLNSHAPVKREQELTGYYRARSKISSTLIKIWTSSKLTRVDESGWKHSSTKFERSLNFFKLFLYYLLGTKNIVQQITLWKWEFPIKNCSSVLF